MYINVIIFKNDYFIQVNSVTVFLTIIADTVFPVSEPLTNFFMGVTEYEKDSDLTLIRTQIVDSIKVLKYVGLKKFRFTYFKVEGLVCGAPNIYFDVEGSACVSVCSAGKAVVGKLCQAVVCPAGKYLLLPATTCAQCLTLCATCISA